MHQKVEIDERKVPATQRLPAPMGADRGTTQLCRRRPTFARGNLAWYGYGRCEPGSMCIARYAPACQDGPFKEVEEGSAPASASVASTSKQLSPANMRVSRDAIEAEKEACEASVRGFKQHTVPRT
eukprot:scaffold80353_cov33-Tisochrysis_lutea.AAC.6